MEADDHFDAQDSTAHNEHRHDAEPNKPEMADNQEDLAADSRRADDKVTPLCTAIGVLAHSLSPRWSQTTETKSPAKIRQDHLQAVRGYCHSCSK